MKGQSKTRNITLVLVLFCKLSFAQGAANSITLSKGAAWNFNLNTPAELENNQTISNAFTLTIKTKSSNCSVYASISTFSTPSGFYPSYSPLQIEYASTTSLSASSIYTSPLTLSTSDQLLFKQSKTSSTYTFNYNMILQAVGYDWYVGTYNFTLTFTMTQP